MPSHPIMYEAIKIAGKSKKLLLKLLYVNFIKKPKKNRVILIKREHS